MAPDSENREGRAEYHLERGEGFLTQTDRKYLLGRKRYENRDSEYRQRTRLRKRIGRALQDFELLWSQAGVGLTADVLEELDMNPDGYDPNQFTIERAIGILFCALVQEEYLDPPAGETFTLSDHSLVEGILDTVDVCASEGEYYDANIKFRMAHYGVASVGELKERFEEGTLISARPLGYLVKEGEISVEEVGAYYEALPEERAEKMKVVDFLGLSTLTHPDSEVFDMWATTPP